MDTELKKKISEAVAIGAKTGGLYLASCGKYPHIAIARKFSVLEDGLSISEFFCPGTLENLEARRKIAVVAYDAAVNVGFQMLGEVEAIKDVAVIDGYLGENEPVVPQVQKELNIRIDRLLDFAGGPHADLKAD